MRFNCTVRRGCISQFCGVLASFERVCQNLRLRLNPAQVEVHGDAEDSSCQVYTMLSVPMMFDTFRCESRSDNAIGIEVSVQLLITALRTAASASSLGIKLSKRDGGPVLLLSIVGSDTTVSSLVQQVPLVRVLTPAELGNLVEPTIEGITPRLELQDLRSLKLVCDRMRRMAKHLSFHLRFDPTGQGGRGRGAIFVRARNETATITATFRDLPAEASRGEAGEQEQPQPQPHRTTALIDSKLICRMLSSATTRGFEARLATLCVSLPTTLLAYTELEGGLGSQTYMMPLKTLADMDEFEQEFDDVGGEEGEEEEEEAAATARGGQVGTAPIAEAAAAAAAAASAAGLAGDSY